MLTMTSKKSSKDQKNKLQIAKKGINFLKEIQKIAILIMKKD